MALVLLATLAGPGALRSWHFFAITGSLAMINTLGASAQPAMIRRVVPKELVTQAVATLNITRQLSIVAAPLVFWLVYDHLGVTIAFAIAACISAASSVFPLLIRASGKPEQTTRQSTIDSLKEGLRYVLRHPVMPGLFGMDIGVQVVTYYRALFPVFPGNSTS